MNINGNEITITEDSLTNALFNGATLEAFGSFTKAEARQAARVMLAGPELLAELKAVFRIFERDVCAASAEQYARVRAAIAKAEGRE